MCEPTRRCAGNDEELAVQRGDLGFFQTGGALIGTLEMCEGCEGIMEGSSLGVQHLRLPKIWQFLRYWVGSIVQAFPNPPHLLAGVKLPSYLPDLTCNPKL